MTINIKEEVIFFNPVYTGEINSVSNEKIKEEIYSYFQKNTGAKKSNFGGKQSHNILQYIEKYQETKKLSSEIYNSVSEIYSLWGFKDAPQIDGFWFNINEKNNFNISHTHPYCKFSAVYYVDCNKNSGDIFFKRPDIQGHYFSADNLTPYTFLEYSYVPKNNNFIIFPSFMEHYVLPNTSDYDRISIAFNFR